MKSILTASHTQKRASYEKLISKRLLLCLHYQFVAQLHFL